MKFDVAGYSSSAHICNPSMEDGSGDGNGSPGACGVATLVSRAYFGKVEGEDWGPLTTTLTL